jgi:hypothetical protein
MTPEKLKLGILLDSYQIPAWIYHCIDRMLNSPYAVISSIILIEDGSVQNANSGIPEERSSIVYRVFNRMDEKIFIRGNNALIGMDVRKLLSDVPIMKVKPIIRQAAIHIAPSDIDELRGYGLDILVDTGCENLRGDILSASKYGVWTYRFEGNPHGFWEVMKGQPETKEELIILGKESQDSRTIYRSSSSTYPFSPARNKNRSLWKSSAYLSRQIAFLYYQGEEKFALETQKYIREEHPHALQETQTSPSNLLSLWLVSGLVLRIIREMLFRIFFLDGWFLLFDLTPDGSTSFKDFKKMLPPKDKFWADPHIIRINGTYNIFLEEYSRRKNKGHISVIEMDEFGGWKAPVKVLEKEYHLSYPFIFEWENKVYMVPESRSNRTIDLYECTEFPDKWKFKQCLMENISAVDTTLVHYCNKWWLFTAMAENDAAGPNAALFLFSSDDLFSGKWKAHPQNPIVSDVKNARPAGSIFIKDGKLFRPSQDCSKDYGYGFDLNEIEILSETDYCERQILSVRPDWDKKIRATHTFATCGNLTVIDALKPTSKFG